VAIIRWGTFAVLFAVLASPIATVSAVVVRDPHGWAAWREIDRFAALAGNTFWLALLSITVAVPVGAIGGVIVARFAVPGRNTLIGLIALGLFVPLPVYAVAWQIAFGSWLPAPGEMAWRPWSQGLLPAAWVHGMAGIPWAMAFVALSLHTADNSVEEEAMQSGGPRAVARYAVGPRVVLGAVAATVWVAIQTATEIAVTDAMKVRTFAEEVYTQLVGFPAGVSAAVAVALPVCAVAACAAFVLIRRLSNLTGANAERSPMRPFRVGRVPRIAIGITAWATVALFVGIPCLALVWKAGGGATNAGFTLTFLLEQLGRVVRLNGYTTIDSTLSAIFTGMTAALLATIACWVVRGSRVGSGLLILLVAVTWVLPAPLVGFGLKELIDLLISLEETLFRMLSIRPAFPPMRSALYDQPSPLPGAWAALIRFFPVAMLIIWPAIRAIPKELIETAMLDGRGPFGQWCLAGWPLTRRAIGVAIIAVAALALGEVGAGKLVVPPQRRVAILELFDQMHYGTEATVAAMGLMQLGLTALIVAVGVRLIDFATYHPTLPWTHSRISEPT